MSLINFSVHRLIPLVKILSAGATKFLALESYNKATRLSGFFIGFFEQLTVVQRSRSDTLRGARGRDQALHGLHRHERTAAVHIGALVIALFGIFT